LTVQVVFYCSILLLYARLVLVYLIRADHVVLSSYVYQQCQHTRTIQVCQTAQNTSVQISVRFEVFTTVTMKNGVFWDVTPCGSCKYRRFGGTSVSFIRVRRIGEIGTTLAVSVRRLLVTTSIVPSPPVLVTLMKEALSSSS
jgi:hypothetical protein